MNLSDKGDSLIKGFEGLRLDAYKDVKGVWTVGYGSTRYHDGKAVKPGDKLANEAQADALFRNTLGQYEQAVDSYVQVPITQNQFDALVSFTYNLGTGALHGSTLLKKLNNRDYQGAANQFLVWDKVTINDKKVPNIDLINRRRKERELFLTA